MLIPERSFLNDETATGTTLCQAITNLNKHGANDISVIVVHNNMPLDWLSRQLCLARFLYLGVNDLHFSDTQEMGSLAKHYEDLIQTYAQKSSLPNHVIAEQTFTWFKENIANDFSDKTTEHLNQEFSRFKSMFNQFASRITIHSLASEFADQVSTQHYAYQKEIDLSISNKQSLHTSDKKNLLFSQKQLLRGKENILLNDPALTNNSEFSRINQGNMP